MAEQLDIESVFKLKVDELKHELGQRNLAKGGSKADLQERLLQYVTKEFEIGSVDVSTEFDAVDVNITKELEDGDTGNDSNVDEEKLPATLEETDKSEIALGDLDSSQDLSDDTQTPLDDVAIPPDEEVDLEIDGDDSEKSEVDGKKDSDEKSVSADSINNDCVAKDAVSGITCTKITTLADTKKSSTKEEGSESDIQKAKIVTLPITNGEKKENRSKRFGEASSESEKKKARLGRFSTVSGLGRGEEVTEEDVEKIKKRAERFGAVSSILTKASTSPDHLHGSTVELKSTHTERLKSRQERFADTAIKKRQERFGAIETQSLTLSSDMEARKQNRLAKFGAV